MKIELKRYENSEYTTGILYINKDPLAYTLEDPVREKKLYGKTAIPYGKYNLTLRTYGSTHENYKWYYQYDPDFHKGMIELTDVKGFTAILIHVGNTVDDTDGCILVGDKQHEGRLYYSRKAYERIYPLIRDAILQEGDVYIDIKKKLMPDTLNTSV